MVISFLITVWEDLNVMDVLASKKHSYIIITVQLSANSIEKYMKQIWEKDNLEKRDKILCTK